CFSSISRPGARCNAGFQPAFVRCGSRPVIRRCQLNVRFARKRTSAGRFMSTRPSPLLALSGLAEMVCKLSALRGEADMRDRVTSTSTVAIERSGHTALKADFAFDPERLRRSTGPPEREDLLFAVWSQGGSGSESVCTNASV